MLGSGVAHLPETRIAQVNTVDGVYLQRVLDTQVAHQHLGLLARYLLGGALRDTGRRLGGRRLRSSKRRKSKDGKEE